MPGPDRPDIPQKPHEVKVTMLGAVYGHLLSDKTTFLLGGVKPGDSFEKRIRVISRDGAPFKILEHRISMRPEDVSLTVEPITDPGITGYDLRLHGKAGDYMGTLGGRILIRTDVPGEETLQFRTAGLVRHPKPK